MSNSKILKYSLTTIFLLALPIVYKAIYPLLPAYSEFMAVYEIIYIIPYIMMSVGLIFSVKIKEYRAFFDTLLFLIVYIIIINFHVFQFGGLQLSDIAQALSLFIPLGIILISIRPQKNFSTNEFFYQLSIIITIIVLTFIVPIYFDAFFNIVFSSHVFINHSEWRLPDYVWFILIIMALVLYLRSNKYNRSLLITLTASVFLLFQCLNLAAVVNSTTHEVKLYIALIFTGLGFFPLNFMLYLSKRKILFDPLTELPNEIHLQNFVKKYNGNCSLAVIEIDQLKQFTDEYGEMERNNLLRFIASHLKIESDVQVYILKYNKYALLYNNVESDEILWQLNSIREKLSRKTFIIRTSEEQRQKSGIHDRGRLENKPDDITVTISAGIAKKSNEINSFQRLYEEALYALNTVKIKGGNRCIRAEDVTY